MYLQTEQFTYATSTIYLNLELMYIAAFQCYQVLQNGIAINNWYNCSALRGLESGSRIPQVMNMVLFVDVNWQFSTCLCSCVCDLLLCI